MNFKNKKFSTMLLLLAAVILTTIHACKDDVEVLSQDMRQLKLSLSELGELDPVNTTKDELSFIKNSHLLIDPLSFSSGVLEGRVDHVITRTTEIKEEYLNRLFPQLQNTQRILTFTALKEQSGIIDGFIIHYADLEGNLKLDAYQRIKADETFERIPLKSNMVAAFTLENTFFIARKLFPNRNIETYGGTGIKNFDANNSYDDVSLLRFIAKYNIPIPGYERFLSLRNHNENARIENDILLEEIIDDGGGRPCALAVHQCMNGDEIRTECRPFANGCYKPRCPQEEAASAYQNNGLITQGNTFEANLPTDKLYTFSDWLQTQPQGQMYVDAYYSSSAHFSASLDLTLLMDIATASYDIGQFVSAMINDNEVYVLSEANYQEFVNIAQASSQNSTSLIYQDLVNVMIDDSDKYRAQDVGEIKSLAGDEISFY